MKAKKLVTLYLSNDELKEAIVCWLKTSSTRMKSEHRYSIPQCIEYAEHLQSNVCDIDWAHDNKCWSVSIDGELPDED